MKIPRYINPSAIPDLGRPSAIAVVQAGGFLSTVAVVAAFGPAKNAHVYLLLPHDVRRRIEDVCKVDTFHDRIPGDPDTHAFLRANGQPGLWHNSENLWVSAVWLRMVRAALPAGCNHSFGSRAAFALLDGVSS